MLVPIAARAATPTTQSLPLPPPLPMVFDTPRSIRCAVAIQKAVQFLVPKQLANGSWQETDNSNPAVGQTALVTLALLSSGMSHQSAPISKALDFLRKTKSTSTYGVALRACVFSQLPGASKLPELRADVQWLENGMSKKPGDEGMYSYGPVIAPFGSDYSNTQYGVLGVWYAATSGLGVPANFWKRSEEAWLRGQQRDGGWGYLPTSLDHSYASMTAAGAATLFITNDFLHASDSFNLEKLTVNQPLQQAIAWLGENFAADHNAGIDTRLGDTGFDRGDFARQFLRGEGTNIAYMLFGFERVGEASGLTRFGTHAWFDEGADFLSRSQFNDGSWTAAGSISGSVEVETAYALLFLSRGNSPVAVQKLQFGNRFDDRPRDVASLISYLRAATETHLNWQRASVDAPASELREAPVLYAASDQPIKLSEPEQRNIANYILRGGVLLAANDGETPAFANSVEHTFASIFPGRTFHNVANGDPIYKGNFRSDGGTLPLRSLGNGVRDFVVLAPKLDLSWKWVHAGGAVTTHLNPYAEAANLWSEQIGANDPLGKGRSTWCDRILSRPNADRVIHIARLKFNGNWDPEPAGWERLANLLHNSGDAELQVERRRIVDLTSADRLAHLTATDDVMLQPAEITALQKWIDSGGLLIFDAAGGSTDASSSVQAMLAALYPNALNNPLPVDHPIYQGHFAGGRSIESVGYRRSASLAPTKLPRLRGLSVDGKLLAILSAEDITAGLVGYPRGTFAGYTPESAAELMRAILLWNDARE